MRCSALAQELDEPMIGSVAMRTRWLLLEDRSAWGADAVLDVFGPALAARAKELQLGLLLVRRREGDPVADAVRRAILVDTVSREMAIRSVTSPAELSVETAASSPVAGFGAPMSGPIFLVCTNGKRDACCALRGRVLVAALAAEHAERVWECTHLGGHRFAGNLVCLPDGIVYGRVTPADGPRLATAYVEGRIDPSHLRGRSAWPAPAQVAEVALREWLGLDGVHDVRLEEAQVGDEVASVTLATPDGRSHRLELRARRSEPRPTSCRGDKVEAPLHWELRT